MSNSPFPSRVARLAAVSCLLVPPVVSQHVCSEARTAFLAAREAAVEMHEPAALQKATEDQVLAQLVDVGRALDTAISLDERIESLTGMLASRLRQRSQEYRALTLWHAWAAASSVSAGGFETLVFANLETELPRQEPVVHKLIVLLDQLRDETHPEPLRDYLQDSPHLVYDLAIHLRHDPDRPASTGTVGDWLWVPSQENLVGRAADPPANARGLASLWTIVYRFLDLSQVDERDGGRIVANECKYDDIVSHLQELAELPALRAAEHPDEPRSLGLRPTRARLQRIAAFLRFRQAVTDPAKLVAVVDDLRQGRRVDTRRDVALTHPAAKDLVCAASPVERGAPDDCCGEAVAWLRYVSLMTFANGDPVFGETGLDDGEAQAFWRRLRPLGGDEDRFGSTATEWPHDRRAGEDEPLRWAHIPARGTVTDLVDRMVRLSLDLLAARRVLERGAEAVLTNDRRAAPRPFGDVWGASVRTDLDKVTELVRGSVKSHGVKADDRRRIEAGEALGRSATTAEQDRFLSHLEALTGMAQSFVDDVESLETITTVDYLTTFGELAGSWRLMDLPTRTLSAYADKLDSALAHYGQVSAEFDARQAVARARQEYEGAVEDHRVAELEYRAAELGAEIAELAVRQGERLREIAALKIQAAELNQHIGKLTKEGRGEELKAMDVCLALQGRVRDLAEAELAALEGALEVAAEIAAKAETELQDYAEQLEGYAHKIRGDRRRGGLVKLVKSIVSVVGAVLAPFTGGSSMLVATGVNRAVDTVLALEKAPWSDLGSAASAIEQAAGGLGAMPLTSSESEVAA